jgi:RNA polymerase sigma factor (sigma-70 family)
MLDPTEQAHLVAAASGGDQAAWNRLVDGFSGLVWSVLRANGLFGADASDAFQTVWLHCVEHLGRIRDPASLAAWLATTARHETYRLSRRSGRTIPVAEMPESPDRPVNDPFEHVESAEDLALFRYALARVSPACQELLRLLAVDPPLSYDAVSSALGMPKGSIGPTRSRCLDRLRRIMSGEDEAA